MSLTLARTGKTIPLTKAYHFMAQDRIQIKEAFSGDVIGLWDPGFLRIGDSLCEGQTLEFEGIPRFSPEHFVRVRDADPGKRKQLLKGLEQLSEEGAVQLFFDRRRLELFPWLGAVGVLQFEVTQHRLKAEYGASVKFEPLPYKHARWVEGDLELDRLGHTGECTWVLDVEDRPLVLFKSEWTMRRAQEENPKVKFVAAVQPGRSARALT
jgi:peptide chain release factor 3